MIQIDGYMLDPNEGILQEISREEEGDDKRRLLSFRLATSSGASSRTRCNVIDSSNDLMKAHGIEVPRNESGAHSKAADKTRTDAMEIISVSADRKSWCNKTNE